MTNITVTAYQSAPPLVREIGAVARMAREYPHSPGAEREFWLRKAALLDRIALRGQPGAAAQAEEAACALADYDLSHGTGPGPADWNAPRLYVRQEYQARTGTPAGPRENRGEQDPADRRK